MPKRLAIVAAVLRARHLCKRRRRPRRGPSPAPSTRRASTGRSSCRTSRSRIRARRPSSRPSRSCPRTEQRRRRSLLNPGQTVVDRERPPAALGRLGRGERPVVTAASPASDPGADVQHRHDRNVRRGPPGLSRTTDSSRPATPETASGSPVGRRVHGLPDERRGRVSGLGRRRRDRDRVRRRPATPLGTQAYSLAAAGFQQFAVGAFAGAVAIGRARLVVTRGRAAGVRRRRRQRHGRLVALRVRGSARGPAGRPRERRRAGERTKRDVLPDGRADLQPVRRRTRASRSPSTRTRPRTRTRPPPTFGVPAGRILDVVDVLRRSSGCPSGRRARCASRRTRPSRSSAGRATWTRRARTPGRTGRSRSPRRSSSFLTSADAGAVVTGIRQNAAFRTNTVSRRARTGQAGSLALKNAAGAHGRDRLGLARRVGVDAAERAGPLRRR